jgi:hypothetical protein
VLDELPPRLSLILAPEAGDLSTEIGGIVGTHWFWRTYDMFPRHFGHQIDAKSQMLCTFAWTWLLKSLSGWWLTYPSEKYEFVSWDDDIPN